MQTVSNFIEKGKIEIKKIEIPQIQEGEILLKILSSGICGTDIKIFSGNKNAPKLKNGDSILGHEFVGEVVSHETEGKNIAIGQKLFVEPDIYCGECEYCKAGATNMCENPKVIFEDYPGAFSQYLVVPAKAVENNQVHEIPSHLSEDVASLIEPLACVIHGQTRLNLLLPIKKKALILGGGPIGCMHALLAKANGYGEVVIADTNPNRINLLKTILADITGIRLFCLNPQNGLSEFDDETPFNMVVQACPDVSALSAGFTKLAKAGGIIAFAGISKGEKATFEAHPLHYKDLHIIGSANYNSEDIKMAIDLLETNKIPGNLLISKSYPLENIQEAMEFAGSGNALKIIIKPNLN